jgi:gamma-glutamyltranspeptidase / glutathione hydrolase
MSIERSDVIVLLLLCLSMASCRADDPVPAGPDRPQSEGTARKFMVSAAHPLAVEAGLAVLRQGGNAVDAAVAVQMVLGFVEPPESGVGGGGFLLYREESTGEMWVYDGRETAPEATAADRFLLPGGLPMPFWAAVVSGRSVGVPGLVSMLHFAHQRHGRLPWAELFEPAIGLAEEGVPMPRRLRRLVARDPSLWLFSGIRSRFVLPARQDEPILSNPELARTYRRIAREGPDAIVSGPTAEAVASAAGQRMFGGDLSLGDLQEYAPEIREPLCGRLPRMDCLRSFRRPRPEGSASCRSWACLEHYRPGPRWSRAPWRLSTCWQKRVGWRMLDRDPMSAIPYYCRRARFDELLDPAYSCR